MAVNDRGEIIVAEYHGGCHLNTNGKKMKSSSRSVPGQLKDPIGVTVDGQGNIVVCENGNNRIQKFPLVALL